MIYAGIGIATCALAIGLFYKKNQGKKELYTSKKDANPRD